VRRGQDASVQPLDQPTAIGALTTSYESLTAVAAGLTADDLLRPTRCAGWDGTEYALKGTGRVALTAADRAQLGAAADRYPLFG
jgi:hypothetical protein